MSENRVSLLSVAARLWYWSLSLAAVLQIGWTIYVSWVHAVSQEHENVHQAAIASAKDSAAVVPLVVAFSVAFVTTVDFIAKGGIMNTAQYVQERFFEPSLRKHREKLRREGREERDRIWEGWNERRMESESRGVPFDEPPPSRTDSGLG